MNIIKPLTKSELTVYNFLLSEINNLDNIKINDISNACFCSSTTIHRTLRKIGYTSYRELKYKIKQKPLISTVIMSDLIAIEKTSILSNKIIIDKMPKIVQKKYSFSNIILFVGSDTIYIESKSKEDQLLYRLLIDKLSSSM